MIGLDFVLGDGGTLMRVKSANAAIFPVNVMGPDTPPEDLGESAGMLQPGDIVTAAGPSVKNPKGAPYTPVTVRGRDGAFWIRSTSIEAAPQPQRASAPVASAASMPVPKFVWWQWLLVGLGFGGVAVGGVYLVRRK